ncbi:shikimate kinase [Schaalia sp. 19OD2882]|uniref:shikimate kinase n=1 Tax=Schaalia sp. 19OD2882 TaxID=2794089 RepID=UPI001C1EB834|nr:shikimate kinase [Schaalia sp. 19OD2882]QWW18715.1 shikimate kinase [Schaalia sp. 19OD2882]
MSGEAPKSALVLVGASGVGKSTVATVLGARWRIRVFDVDEVVADRLGASVGDLVIAKDTRLEEERRRVALAGLAVPATAEEARIVVLGTSQVLDEEVVGALQVARRRGAQVVELTADTAEISRREGLNAPRSVGLGAPRAMLTAMLRTHHAACEPLADTSIDTCERTPEQVADAVEATCRLSDGRNSAHSRQ